MNNVTRMGSLAMAVVGVALLAGCETAEPRYPAARVVFDPGLMGTWESVKAGEPEPAADEAGDRFEIVSRQVKVEEGRFCGGVIGEEDANADPKPSVVDAYVVRTIKPPEPAKAEGEPAVASKAEAPEEFWAVLLTAGEHRLLGLQPRRTGSALTEAMHLVIRVRRDGDVLWVEAPKYPVVWLPDMQWLDEPRGEGAEKKREVPTVEEFEKRNGKGKFLTLDADRLLEVYSARAGDAAFWGDPSKHRRVGAGGAGAK